jgi:alpha-beta hydrolase superfamily lysophospholipase
MSAEFTCTLGRAEHIVATVTQPDLHVARVPWVMLLTNSGVIPRSGPHRMNVHLARRLAKLGVASIRFDLSGLGDTQRPPGTAYVGEQWIADTRDVMNFAQVQFSCQRFAMIGFCSGAYVAYKTALQDERLAAAVLWDLYAYPTMQSRLRTLAYRLHRTGVMGAVAKLTAKLKQNISAQPSAEEQQTFASASSPSAQEYADDLNTLSARGMALIILHSGGEPMSYNYRGQFDASLGQLGLRGKVDFDYLQRSDHLLTQAHAQQLFTETVLQWLVKRQWLASTAPL